MDVAGRRTPGTVEDTREDREGLGPIVETGAVGSGQRQVSERGLLRHGLRVKIAHARGTQQRCTLKKEDHGGIRDWGKRLQHCWVLTCAVCDK